MGVNVVQPEGDVLWVFVLHFHNGKCHRIANGEMFPIRMRKLDNISVRQTYRWKARFVGFLVMYSVSTSTSGFMGNLQNKNSDSAKSRNIAATAATRAAAAADRIASNTCPLRRHRSSTSRGLLLQQIPVSYTHLTLPTKRIV